MEIAPLRRDLNAISRLQILRHVRQVALTCVGRFSSSPSLSLSSAARVSLCVESTLVYFINSAKILVRERRRVLERCGFVVGSFIVAALKAAAAAGDTYRFYIAPVMSTEYHFGARPMPLMHKAPPLCFGNC
jgi:hypothetical protein